ncbi:hypothetical protein QA601_03845 [Chitinispirillales bacterium ANBcel5]|uniref:hypothetical protein n=1 Tax=Cellulosispirillum alkaliphilum TaxID=3039283 RepID=UPI002A56ECD9|nr:hypothetical protein [Chitinispirillales bacterium ANBcel5]
MRGKNLISVALIAALVVLVVVAVMFQTTKQTVREHQIRATKLQEKVDSLQARVSETEDRCPPGLSQFHKEGLVKQGITDPNLLLSDLKERPELIPYEGVLGGTMFFPSEEYMWFVSDYWVLAYFEDGHRAGYLFLEYEVSQGGDIFWKVVTSQLQ